MNPYLEIIRPVNGVMAALAVIIGFVVSGGHIALSTELICATFAILFLLSGGMAINDYYDYDIDLKRKKYRPIPSGRISRKSAFAYSIALFVASMFFGYLINTISFIIIVAMVILLFVYSNKMSKSVFTGNIIIATCTALAFVFGAAANGNIFAIGVASLAGMAFFATLAREIYKDIQDLEEDNGVRETLPMKIGIRKATFISALALVFTIVLSPLPYLLGLFGEAYLFLIALVGAGFMYTAFRSLSSKNFSKEVLHCKALQFSALLIFLISSL